MKQNPAERLCEFVMRQHGRRLTPKQIREPWTYIGTYNGEISGVVIAADGEHTGFRVMLTDLEAPAFDGPPRALELA